MPSKIARVVFIGGDVFLLLLDVVIVVFAIIWWFQIPTRFTPRNPWVSTNIPAKPTANAKTFGPVLMQVWIYNFDTDSWSRATCDSDNQPHQGDLMIISPDNAGMCHSEAHVSEGMSIIGLVAKQRLTSARR